MTMYRDKILAAIASLAVTAAIFLSQGLLLESAPQPPGAQNRVVQQQLEPGKNGILTGRDAEGTGRS